MSGVENRTKLHEYFRTSRANDDRKAISPQKDIALWERHPKIEGHTRGTGRTNATKFFELRILCIMLVLEFSASR